MRALRLIFAALASGAALTSHAAVQGITGIHDYDPDPAAFLGHISAAGQRGWVTATEAIGDNPGDFSGKNFGSHGWAGSHTVITRLNYGYSPQGTVPVPSRYDEFATRCANFVNASSGCNIWVIGNETNLAIEWPYNAATDRHDYVSPAMYADCFRQCYAAIKAVRPNDQVVVQAMAPWGGPYGPGTNPNDGKPHDGNPLNWCDYLYETLVAIQGHGITPDGIAMHVNSRGWALSTITSDTSRVDAGGLSLAFGWQVHREWIFWGVPRSLWHLPLYGTEDNGLYFWQGGGPVGPGDPAYAAGWLQAMYASLNDWNVSTRRSGMPIYHCANLYRWANDGWTISGAPQLGQIYADLDASLTAGHTVPLPSLPMSTATPGGSNVGLASAGATATASSQFAGRPPSAANDGLGSTRWASAGNAGNVEEHWLAIDLGQSRAVTGVRLLHGQVSSGSAAHNARCTRIESAPAAGGPWSVETVDNNRASASTATFSFPSSRWLRHLRMYITDVGTTTDNARVAEFEIYANLTPGTETLDNPDFNFTAPAGGWTRGTSAADKFGTDYVFATTSAAPTATARWTPALIGGQYEVQVWHSQGANRPTDARFTVVHAGGSATVPVNQEINGGQWNSLGIYTFNTGTAGYVQLSNESTQANQAAIADAVRFVPASVPAGLALFGVE